MKSLLFALALFLVPALASAQATNPTQLQFDSIDHAQAIRYEVGYFMGAATSPMQTASVPVAQVNGSAQAGRSLALPRPTFGNFTAKLRLVAIDPTSPTSAEITSPWSNATAPFVFSPLAPTVRGLQ